MIESLAIVGGGTSGLVTALILKKSYPNLKIDLIESKAIGIVGVGEGSTEHWTAFMKACNIDKAELVRETDATFKYGINFANWNGDGRSYFHSVNGEFNIDGPGNIKFLYAHLISKGVDALHLVQPYVIKSELVEGNYGINQFHFNTFKLNDYLHKKCTDSGVNFIEAEIESVKVLENGEIDSVLSTDGRHFKYEFFIDSTGFSRFLMQKSLGIKWQSYSKYLPMNSAIAFPTENLDEIPAWTLSRSMNSGWLWRIPTQTRFGNGYVFNDSFLDFEEAQKEVENLYGHDINVAKKIKFDAGKLERSWHMNCAAVGLSSSFIEPLEASSIGTSIQQAFLLADYLPSYIKGSKFAENEYNKNTDSILENILDFVSLHYRCKRNDTDFWKSVKDLPITDSLNEKLDLYKYKLPSNHEFQNNRVLFQAANWILVMHGLGLISKDVADSDLKILPKLLRDNAHIHLPNFFDDKNFKFISHREAINNLIRK
jgi:tryptophan halogenase